MKNPLDGISNDDLNLLGTYLAGMNQCPPGTAEPRPTIAGLRAVEWRALGGGNDSPEPTEAW